MFVDAMKKTLNEEFNYAMTENGALGYRTTGSELLDLNFAVSSLRDVSEYEIVNKFMKAFYEDKMLAMKWLFFARDARKGLGERRLFRVVIKNLVETNPEMVIPLINLISEYGRYDDVLCLLDNKESAEVIFKLIEKQLSEDLGCMNVGRPISLISKWLPSSNASSKETKRRARQIYKALNLTERQYRQILSKLRKYLDVTEVKMSAKEWDKINYETVPSRANLIYGSAFIRNDEVRRIEYLKNLEKGEVKINADVLYPHDIVHKYTDTHSWRNNVKPKDETLEALWKALPDNVDGCDNTIVVADGSGSMTVPVGNINITALDVANALAIYFAERSSGQFKDKYITFSENPQFVDFSKCDSLHDKIKMALTYDEVANTNIEKVFDLILTTAVKHNMSQEDIPKNILILSDLEFDACTTCGKPPRHWYEKGQAPDARLFEVIKQKYEDAGYKIPRLVFWNLNSRTGTIPVKENELGVALVSGFSTNICKMVMSSETDPYKCLLEVLNSDRYTPIESALSAINI